MKNRFFTLRATAVSTIAVIALLGAMAFAGSDNRAPKPAELVPLNKVSQGKPLIATYKPMLSRPIPGSIPGTTIQRDTSTGATRRMRGVVAVPGATTPQEAAIGFLQGYGSQFGLSPDLSDLKSERSVDSLTGHHITFSQVYGGMPVFYGKLSVHTDKNLAVTLVNNDLKPIAQAVAVRKPADSSTALKAAIEAVGAQPASRYTPTAQAGVFVQNGRPVAAWKINYRSVSPPASWEVVVDATTNQKLRLRNVAQYVDGTGMVFNVNPVITKGDAFLTDSNNADSAVLTGERMQVTLQGLDNSGFLDGIYASTSSTTTTRVNQSNHIYDFTRSQSGFEEVMVYYNVDSIERYIQSLGFNNIQNRVQVCNANDGLTNFDNSFYDPFSKEIEFGAGGVDDAEDADVIWHECGHAIHDNQVPGWGNTEEGGAMGEGFGDYWAATNSAGIGPNAPGWDVFIAEWDAVSYAPPPAPGDPFSLRRLDSTKHYPEDIVFQVHADGEIWSACLWQIRGIVGRTRADTMILESHFQVSVDGQFADGALAILAANAALYGGADQAAIYQVFIDRGILSVPPDLDLQLEPSSVLAGDISTATVILKDPAPAGGATITVTSSDTAAAPVPDTIFIPEGGILTTFDIQTADTGNGVVIADISVQFGSFSDTEQLRISPYVTEVLFFNGFFWVPDIAVTGGQFLYSAVVIAEPAPTPGGTVVNLVSEDPNICQVTPSVTVPPGQDYQYFYTFTKPVAFDQTVAIRASARGSSAAGTVTVLAPVPTRILLSPSTVEGGKSSGATVYMTGPAPNTGLDVMLASDRPEARVGSGILHIQPGKNFGAFVVTTDPVSNKVVANISASYNGVSASAPLTITAPGLSSFTISPNQIGANGTATATAVLGSPAPAGGVTINLSYTNGSALTVKPASLFINAGAKSGTATLKAGTVTNNTQVTVTASYKNTTKQATVTVLGNRVTAVTANPQTLHWGTKASCKVYLASPAPLGGAVVTLSATMGQLPAQVTVPYGYTSAAFNYTAPTNQSGKAIITASYPAGVNASTTVSIIP